MGVQYAALAALPLAIKTRGGFKGSQGAAALSEISAPCGPSPKKF